MIAGWHQWADAGDVSSGLPRYLINRTRARKIGEVKPDGFYLFQIPGAHHLVRPVVKLKNGHRESLQRRKNEFYYAEEDEKGFFIFLGEEPHRNETAYAETFLNAAEELQVKRTAILGGVHGAVPHDRNRQISCVYSLPRMRGELEGYGIKLSDYEGGTTIGTYLADRAEARDIELVVFYAIVPCYTVSIAGRFAQRLAMKVDHKAWYDLMIRLNHMFRLGLDPSDLETRSEQLISAWDVQIEELARLPQCNVQDYLREVNEDFTEPSFAPLSDAWGDALGEIFANS
jgi:proteasome assembly chaperone (PAC2) family protein